VIEMSLKFKPLSLEEVREIFLKVVELLKKPVKEVIEKYDVKPVLSNSYYEDYENWYRSAYRIKLTNDITIDTRGEIEVLRGDVIYKIDVPYDLHIALSAWEDKIKEYLEERGDNNEGSN